jgi:hypothetical protein
VGEFDDEAEDARGPPVGAQHRYGVADLADLIATRIEHGDAGEPGEEDPAPARHAKPRANVTSEG